MPSDYCKASIKDSPEPGDLRCIRLGKTGRDDGLCGQHGRMLDAGQEIAWANDGAPTLRQIYDCWSRIDLDQKKHTRDARGTDYTRRYSTVQWEMLLWLRAWRLFG